MSVAISPQEIAEMSEQFKQNLEAERCKQSTQPPIPPPPPPPGANGSKAVHAASKVVNNTPAFERALDDAPDPDEYDQGPRQFPGAYNSINVRPACSAASIVPKVSEPAIAGERKKRNRRPGERRQPKEYAKQEGRFGTINTFMRNEARKLPSTAVGVWGQLWVEERNGLVKGMSQKTIGERIGKDARTARTAIRLLEQLGYLIVVKTGKRGEGESWYQLHATPIK
jgi:hypothetical protein